MSSKDNELNKHPPLLGDDDGDQSQIDTQNARQSATQNRRRVVTTVCGFTARFLYSTASALVQTPPLQLQEGILCDRFNPPGLPDTITQDDPQWRCKRENVQHELSILRQWLIMS
jgi:hypothetical protein